MLLNRRISFLSNLRSKYDHYLPCQLKALFYTSTPINTLSSNQIWRRKNSSKRSHHAFHAEKPTTIKTPIRPQPSEQLLSSNDSKYWTQWSFATNGQGQLTQRIEQFVRTRSLDECKVASSFIFLFFLSRLPQECDLFNLFTNCIKITSTAQTLRSKTLQTLWNDTNCSSVHDHSFEFWTLNRVLSQTKKRWKLVKISCIIPGFMHEKVSRKCALSKAKRTFAPPLKVKNFLHNSCKGTEEEQKARDLYIYRHQWGRLSPSLKKSQRFLRDVHLFERDWSEEATLLVTNNGTCCS